MKLPQTQDPLFDPFRTADNAVLPPKTALLSLLSLVSLEEVAQGAAYSIRTRQEDKTRWDLYAVTSNVLAHVSVLAAISVWEWADNDRNVELTAWSKPIRAIESISVSDINVQADPYADVTWDPTYVVTFAGDETIALPTDGRSNNPVERERLETFTQALIRAYNTVR